MKTLEHKQSKKTYFAPLLSHIIIDAEISLNLESEPPTYENENDYTYYIKRDYNPFTV